MSFTVEGKRQALEEAITNAQIVIEKWMETEKFLNCPMPESRGILAYA